MPKENEFLFILPGDLTDYEKAALHLYLRILKKVERKYSLQGECSFLPQQLIVKSAITNAPAAIGKQSFFGQFLKKMTSKNISEPQKFTDNTIRVYFRIPSEDIKTIKKSICFLHGLQPNEMQSFIDRLGPNIMVVTNSKSERRKFVETHKLSEDMAPVVYPYYKRDIFYATQKKQLYVAARTAQGFNEQTVVVGYSQDNFTDTHLIQELADSLHAQKSIRLVGYPNLNLQEPDKQKDKFQFYHSLDYFVATNKSAQFHLPTLEAMACGIPVISHAEDYASELISSKQTVLRVFNAKTIAEFITDTQEQKDWLQAVGRQNSENAILFDENQHIKKVTEIFTETLAWP